MTAQYLVAVLVVIPVRIHSIALGVKQHLEAADGVRGLRVGRRATEADDIGVADGRREGPGLPGGRQHVRTEQGRLGLGERDRTPAEPG